MKYIKIPSNVAEILGLTLDQDDDLVKLLNSLKAQKAIKVLADLFKTRFKGKIKYQKVIDSILYKHMNIFLSKHLK